MIVVSVVFIFLPFYIRNSLSLEQSETYKKVYEDARIDSTPIIELQLIEDALNCARACISNLACISFAFSLANKGQCYLYHENLEQMKIALVKNWSIFTIDKFSTFAKFSVVEMTTTSAKIWNASQLNNASHQEEIQFNSTCTLEEHLVPQVSQWSTVHTLSWNGENGVSFSFPPANNTNTQWKLIFDNYADIDFGTRIECLSLDAKFRAVSVRLFAVVVEANPLIWMECADVLKVNETSNYARFSMRMSQLPTSSSFNVRVRVQWTELSQLPSTANFRKNDTTTIRYRWRLNDWKIVTPTSNLWFLYSEPFGQDGALWRIYLLNVISGGKRDFMVVVELQHLPSSINWSTMSWKCSLVVWNQTFDEQKYDMVERSSSSWELGESINSESRNPLDIKVVVNFSANM